MDIKLTAKDIDHLKVDDLVESLMPYLGTTFLVDVNLGVEPYNEVVLIMHKDGSEIKIPFEFSTQM